MLDRNTLQVSIYDQSTFSFKHLSFMVPIISKSNPHLEIVPVTRSFDFIPPLQQHQIFVLPYLLKSAFELFKISNKMEEIDECLLITSIEVSCWKEQLRQVVSQYYTLNILHAIQIFSF